MKKLILIAILLFSFQAIYSQIIKGIVIDKNTNEAIPMATIYFSETSYGTSADIHGEFEIDVSKFKLKPLTFSAVGYFSKTIEDFYEDEKLVIKLKPKIYEIDEAQIKSKSLVRQRKRNLRLFRNEFIGTTENAWYCEILNENDITFNYFEDEDTLKAYASKPLVIKNKALGYTITYYLDVFEYYKESDIVFFSGDFIFQEDSIANQELVKENRIRSYTGSRVHFLRSLWADNLKANNFKIVDLKEKQLKYKDIVIEDMNHNKFLDYNGTLKVYYFNTYSTVIISNLVYFDKYGNFSLNGIWWKGPMGTRRIADWLPIEYNTESIN